MIWSDLVAATGPGMRRARMRFLGLSAVVAALQAGVVVALVPVFEELFGPDPVRALPWVAGQVVAFVLAWVLDGAAMRAGLEVGLDLMRVLGEAGADRIHAMDPEELTGEEASRLRTLVVTASSEVTSMPVLILGPLIQAVLLVPMLGLALCAVDWRLGLTALGAGLLLFLALRAGRAMGARSDAAHEAAESEVDDRALEFGWAQPTLRAAGRGVDTVAPSLRAARAQGLRALAWQVPGELVFTVVLQLSLIAFVSVTTVLYTRGELVGPAAAALVVVLLRIVESAGSLQLLSAPLTRASNALPRIRELVEQRDARLRQDRERERDGAREAVDRDPAASASASVSASAATAPPPPPTIRLADLGYRYPDDTAALTGVTTVIPAGRLTAVVGASGSGKSTLAEVIAGLREPTTGSVLLGGGPRGPRERLAATSVVFQDTLLRRGTLRENVTAGREVSDADLDAIATRAGLGPVLAAAGGWDGPVGEGGRTLSGGERQRVGVARALAKPAEVLVVDEATSALDPGTERTVVEAVAGCRGETTVVAVTHRPALVALADHVVVLDGGRVVESGTREELLAADGRLAHLWRKWQEAERWVLA